MDTVAGPGFCARGQARPDPESSRVGALAADASGTLWFESGAPHEGLLTKVVSSASIPVLRTGVVSSGEAGGDARGQTPANHGSAALLAANRNGGLLLGVSKAVVEYSDDFATVAGAIPPPGADAESEQAGDGGTLRAARFKHISSIASDSAGNVYVADRVDNDGGEISIRFLNRTDRPVTFYGGTPHERTVASGTVATIAGGERGPAGPIVAESAVLAVAADRLYLAAAGPGGRAGVRMLNLGGSALSTHGVAVSPGDTAEVATAVAPDSADRGSARASALSGIAADEQGSLFLAEPANHRVRRLDPTGAVTTFAGTGAPGFNGNDRRATEARLDRPYDVEVGAGGRIYISDTGNAQVRVVDQAGTIRTALGNGTTNRWLCVDDEGPSDAAAATAGPPARTGVPKSVATDAAGNVYVAAAELGQVHRLAPSGSLRPVAGRSCDNPAGCRVGDGAAPTEAILAGLSALRLGPAGGLYVLEATRVRFLNVGGRPVTVHGVAIPAGGLRTVMGKSATKTSPPPTPVTPSPTIAPIPAGPPPTTPDGEPAIAHAPGITYTAIAADDRRNVVLADIPEGPFFSGNGSVRHVDSGGIITTLVDRPGLGPEGTVDPTRCCAYPGGLVTDTAGNLYIADTAGRRVWFLNRSQRPVVVHGVAVPAGRLEPVAGGGRTGSQDEGIPAPEARLSAPMGLALDGDRNLYIADVIAHSVRRVDAGGIITTVAGNGQPGFNGDGLKGQLAALNQPTDVAIDACGNLLVTDSGNDRVRRLNLVNSCPTGSPTATAGTPGPWRYAAAAAVVALAGAGAIILFGRWRHRNPLTLAEAGRHGG